MRRFACDVLAQVLASEHFCGRSAGAVRPATLPAG